MTPITFPNVTEALTLATLFFLNDKESFFNRDEASSASVKLKSPSGDKVGMPVTLRPRPGQSAGTVHSHSWGTLRGAETLGLRPGARPRKVPGGPLSDLLCAATPQLAWEGVKSLSRVLVTLH